MGNSLNKPVTEKTVESFVFEEKTGALVDMQGWRTSMEDAHVIEVVFQTQPDIAFFAVYDGHGGAEASKYCSEHAVEVLKTNFTDCDFESVTQEDAADRFKQAYMELDGDMREDGITSGTTAVCGFVTPKRYIIANLGDSRCVLCSSDIPKFSTKDHKPNNPEEKERILKADGFVINNRVNADLAVSRTLGDFTYKDENKSDPSEQAVSCQPDITILDRNDEDNYLLFACDGIWDVFPQPEEMAPVMKECLQSYEKMEDALAGFLDICLDKGSKDNMTVLLVPLKQMYEPDPKMIEERMKREEEERLRKIEEERLQKEEEERLQKEEEERMMRGEEEERMMRGEEEERLRKIEEERMQKEEEKEKEKEEKVNEEKDMEEEKVNEVKDMEEEKVNEEKDMEEEKAEDEVKDMEEEEKITKEEHEEKEDEKEKEEKEVEHCHFC